MRTILAKDITDEHIGAEVEWTRFGAKTSMTIRRRGRRYDDVILYGTSRHGAEPETLCSAQNVTILREAPIKHPEEPTTRGTLIRAYHSSLDKWYHLMRTTFGWRTEQDGLYTWEAVKLDTNHPIEVLYAPEATADSLLGATVPRDATYFEPYEAYGLLDTDGDVWRHMGTGWSYRFQNGDYGAVHSKPLDGPWIVVGRPECP